MEYSDFAFLNVGNEELLDVQTLFKTGRYPCWAQMVCPAEEYKNL
jgi:hypothetical protein